MTLNFSFLIPCTLCTHNWVKREKETEMRDESLFFRTDESRGKPFLNSVEVEVHPLPRRLPGVKIPSLDSPSFFLSFFLCVRRAG